MNYMIIYLILFELFSSNLILYLINLINLRYFGISEDNEANSEIIKLEKEIKDLNRPSTFKEYVRKSRQLNTLKREQKEKNLYNKFNNKNYFRPLYYIMKIFHIILGFIQFIPVNLRQLFIFIIINRYFDQYKYIIYIDRRLYLPFYQNEEKLIYLNTLTSYGIISTIYSFIKYITNYLYLSLNSKKCLV